ncbi:hypothetical protein VOLCADRAFT_119932, partial [Volvox carteri f. nagariensis]
GRGANRCWSSCCDDRSTSLPALPADVPLFQGDQDQESAATWRMARHSLNPHWRALLLYWGFLSDRPSAGDESDGGGAVATVPAAASVPAVVPYTDPAGRFRLVRPCGWIRVSTLLPESSVLASFYNPEEPGAETLAVYRAPAPAGVQATQQLGSEVAAGLAGVAPNGLVIEARNVKHGGDDGDRDYIIVHVQFGGNTAGMFGAAREFRAITIAEGWQYTMRLTTTRYRYLAFSQVQDLMKAVSESFEVLA